MPSNINTQIDTLVGYGMDKMNPGGLIENNDTIGQNVPKPGNFTTLTSTGGYTPAGDITLANGKAIETDITTGHTAVFKAYDVDGAAYKIFATLTNGNTPSFAIAAPSGGTVTIDGAVIGGNAPLAGTFTNSTTTGYRINSVGNALTAVGTNRATALQLSAQVNNITTATSGTGVILPVGVVGMRITIFNAGANLIQVYASASETIDTTAGSSGVALTNTKRCEYFFVATNTWISAQLGVVSA